MEGRLLWIYGHASSTRRKREVGRPVTHLDSVGRHAMQDGGLCCSGGRLSLGFSLFHTLLMWEPLALAL